MANSKKSFADGFTIESLIGGSDSGPGNPTRSGKGYKGAPTLLPVNAGEKVTTTDSSDKDIYPPVYGGGKRQITITRAKRKGRSGGGYTPTSTDITNSPKGI